MCNSGCAPDAVATACGRLADPDALKLFKALADPTRVSLLAGLARSGPVTVGEAAGCCPIDVSVVSRHIAVLREAGVVECEKRGKQVHCRVRFAALARSLRQIADAIDACCPSDVSQTKEAAT